MFELDFEDVNPMQITLYGHTNWTLITHIAGPLAIFFRFHSAACIFDVFHTSYREPRSCGKKSLKSLGQYPAGHFQTRGIPVVAAAPSQQQAIPVVPIHQAVAVPANQNRAFSANQMAANNFGVGGNRMIISQSCKEMIYCYNNFTNIYYNNQPKERGFSETTI